MIHDWWRSRFCKGDGWAIVFFVGGVGDRYKVVI